MSKTNLLGATMPHTAGIFSDMTVDGPEIGTLVVIVDRAKNLPNRKTIGKQDPYCAARLGKEAKKTETDRRGGQTPRWDQEMRFTVHDSPDYYQLKVSVFNDDKKTEIIGETWVNLAEVVIPGGGKNDLWHNLNFKGKYAGEIRIEITYYDSRPKAEKSLEKKRQAAAKEISEAGRDSMGGPRQMKAVKRRPLPNNPTSASPSPARPSAAVSDQSHGSARGRALPHSEPTFDHPSNHARDSPASDYMPNPASIRGRQAPDPVADHMQTPPRGRQLPQEYQISQSPLQQVEYNTPPRFPQSNSHRSSAYDTNGYHSSPGPRAISPAPVPLPVSERYDIYDPAPPGTEYIPGNVLGRYDDLMNDGDISPMTYHAQPEQSGFTLPPPGEYSPPSSPGGPPPPPPLHGARRASPLPPPVTANDNWDMPNFADNANFVVPDDPYDPSRHVTHRKSMPAYAHAKSYEAYSPPKEQQRPQSRDQRSQSRDQRPQSRDHQPASRHNSYDDRRDQPRDQYETTPRHHSYDDRFHNDFGSMQPTVEDAPPSPGPGAFGHPSPSSFSRGYDERRSDQVPSPAPLSLNGRGSAASGRQSISTQSSFQMSNGYSSTGSPTSFMDRTQNSSLSSQRSSTRISQQYQPPRRRESEDRVGGSPGGPPMPHVPSSLVAGMDPLIAEEVSARIYSDQRSSFSNPSTFPRNGYHSEAVQAPYQQSRPSSYGRQDRTSVFVPASTPNSFSQQSIVRKSVSPSPAMRDRSRSPAPPRERRLSGIPFGPDDYDALNPNVGSTTISKSGIQFSGATESKRQQNPDEKIISHDGREIDPSDYLPVDTYAAEYEKKTGSKPAPAPLQTAASLALARPRMVPASNSAVYMIKPSTNPTTPGRTRLQKKSARNGGGPPAPIPITSSVGPLAPITPYQDNTNAFTPRPLPRASTGDFLPSHNENYAPSNPMTNYGSHSPGYSGRGSGPPIPAKIPVSGGMGGGQQQHQQRFQGHGMGQQQQVDHGEAAWSLLEEMKSIDLGSGSSRARHGRKGW